MQLDAFLRSAKRYAPYKSIVACWPGNLDDGYSQTLEDNAVARLPEYMVGSFESAVRWFLREHERVVFHTDDDVFFRQAPAPPDCDIFSYRLGLNTVYCHPLDQAQRIPNGVGAHANGWVWQRAEHDFGYPLCLNGTVYRSADLLPLLDFPFSNPTELEAGLAYRAVLYRPERRHAPLHSCCVSLPHNRVSSSSGCRTGTNPDWQPDLLRDRYLAGERIDLEQMNFAHIIGAHQEVPLCFRTPKRSS